MSQNSQRAVILVVDDNATDIDVIKSILCKEYFVQAALNGKMALKIIEKKKPDLVLLDIMMPEMNGYEVCRQLKENQDTASIPVIFFTARNEEDDEVLGLDLGAVDYITKPVKAAILRARVKTHLGRRQMEKKQKVYESLIIHNYQAANEAASFIKSAVEPEKTVARFNTISTQDFFAELESIAALIKNYDTTAEEAVVGLLERVESHQFCTALVLLYKYLTDYDFETAAAHLSQFIMIQKAGEIRP